MAEVKKELKPCPFCGGKIKLDEDDFYMFCCDKCGAGITFAKELEDGRATDCNKKESIEKWNRRANEPTAYDPDKVVKKLEKCANGNCVRNSDSGRCPYIGNSEIDCEKCAMLRAIEIVKAGGVDA